MHPSALKPVPWLAPGIFLRNEIALIAGQGGSAKTVLAVTLIVAMAGGRSRVGPVVFKPRADGRPLRGAIFSAEETVNSLNLLITAAAMTLGLSPVEIAAVGRNLVIHDVRTTGWRATKSGAIGLGDLEAALTSQHLDLVIFDTAASILVLENENDNSAVTNALTDIGRFAAAHDLAVVILHHTPKQTRERAAEQRGEVTLVRGVGGFANSPRVVLSITSLPEAESNQFLVQGAQPASIRRLEHAKANDCAHMSPAYFQIVSAQVQVNNGTSQEVRAIQFIASPSPANSPVVASPSPANLHAASIARRTIVMKAIDTGATDAHGVRVPLSAPGSGGSTNGRKAIAYIVPALMNAEPGLSQKQAEHLAKAIIEDLCTKVGCVAVEDVKVPQYKPNGASNGMKDAKGLVCRWHLAPWVTPQAPAAQAGPSVPPVGPTGHATLSTPVAAPPSVGAARQSAPPCRVPAPIDPVGPPGNAEPGASNPSRPTE